MASYGMTAQNCTMYDGVVPNPDISGIGMLASFMSTAYLAAEISIALYVIDLRKRSTKQETPRLDRWSFAFEKTLQSFSDQQIVTGISIIIGGLSQLSWEISSYHWQIVVNLAWLSTVTHLITLTSLRNRITRAEQRKPPRILRIIAMGVLILMLMAALAPLGFLENSIPDALPAWCLYHPGVVWRTSPSSSLVSKDYNISYVLIACGILVYGYSSRVFLLFPAKDGFLHGVLRVPPRQPWSFLDARLEALLRSCKGPVGGLRKHLYQASYKVFRSFCALLVVGATLYSSTVWEFTWLLFALSWGTIRVLVSHRKGDQSSWNAQSNLPGVIAEEQNWGFGQVVAIILLVLPVLSFLDAFFAETPQREAGRMEDGKCQASAKVSFRDPILSYKSGKSFSDAWCNKLIILWYFLSIEIAADILYVFSFSIGTSNLYLHNKVAKLVTNYAILTAFNLAILWASTLIFLDQDLRSWWEESTVGKYISKSPFLSRMLWTLVLVSLLGGAVGVDIWLKLWLKRPSTL